MSALSHTIPSGGSSEGSSHPNGEPVGTVIGIIAVIVVIAAVIAAVVLVRRNKQKRIDGMSPAERELHDAQIEYDSAVKAAEKAHTGEVRAREKRLKAAQSAVAAAQTIGGRKLGSYRGKDGSVTLTETTITTNQGTFPLGTDITAVADTAGNLATSSKTSLGRVAAGGILLGPAGLILGGVAKKTKMHDTRELYLLVEAPDRFAALITCNPDDGQKVRQLAMSIKQASMNVSNVLRQRETAIAGSARNLEIEQGNVADVNAAAAAVEAARNNSRRLDTAKLALPATPAAGGLTTAE